MTKELKPGDMVTWGTPQGETHGLVEKKVTSETRIKGHVATPTKENPEYLVKSDKSGKKAVHKPDELKKH